MQRAGRQACGVTTLRHRVTPSQPVAPERDDAVLPATRALSAFIVPFLLVAFVVLYGYPRSTGRLFAWKINPPMTPMTLGAVYIGGAYFFVQAFRATQWHTVKAGFVAVGTFATLLGIATIMHWDRFNHDHVAFWLWAGLYFTTPLLVWGVWLANRRREAPPHPDDLFLPSAARRVMGATAGLAVVVAVFLFLAPQHAIDTWPWMLTPPHVPGYGRSLHARARWLGRRHRRPVERGPPHAAGAGVDADAHPRGRGPGSRRLRRIEPIDLAAARRVRRGNGVGRPVVGHDGSARPTAGVEDLVSSVGPA